MPKDTSSSRKGNIRTSPSKARGPMHCNKCNGRPMRSECMHTEAGRAFIKLRAECAPEPQRAARSSPRCTICDGRPLRSQCLHTRMGQIYLQEQQILNELQPASETNNFTASSVPVNLSGHPLVIPLDAPTNQLPPSLHGPNQPGPLRVPSTPPSTPRMPPSSPSAKEADSQEDSETSPALRPSQQPDSPPPALPASKSKPDNTRATKANPKHGFVRGMRGADRHDIVRKHGRPEAIPDAKTASKRFLENMNRLIEKSDDLAASTGCWLFIGAQHCGGVGATVHYTSPRLLRDAGEQMNGIANDFHDLMTNLLQARRTDALELTKKLKQVEIEKEEANKKVDGLNSKVDGLSSKVISQEKLLRVYASRLGVDVGELEALVE